MYHTDDKQPANATGWQRVNAVHNPKPGEMSRDMFVRECLSGAIPVTLRRYGPRLLYVNVAEYEAWSGVRTGLTVPGDAQRANENLFI
jgi:hypothetical protein